MTRPRRTVAEPSPATPDAHAPALQQSVGNYAVIGLAQRGTPALVQSVLERSGQPLAGRLRAQMESRFGQSFAPVRVHTDVAAAASAEALDAHAYSVGNDIVFGPGEFAPATASGTRLLAHELAHVVRHLYGDDADAFFDNLDATANGAEAEADKFALDGLIPQAEWAKIKKLSKLTANRIREEARRLVVHPAVIAGRIRREKHNYSIFSQLVGQGQVRRMFPDWRY